MSTPPPSAAADSALSSIAGRAITSMLACHPVQATYLGAHDRDSHLDDPSPGAASTRTAELRSLLRELDAAALDPADTVDAAVLHTVCNAELLELEHLRDAEWDPMRHNPGGGLHALLSREFAPLPLRLESVAGRLAEVPGYLAAARQRLGEMSRVHLDTALTQLAGTITMLDTELPRVLDEVPQLRSRVEPVLDPARAALAEHRRWLTDRADTARREPRLGVELFARKLALTLDTEFAPESLLARAEAELERLSTEIIEHAAAISGEHGADDSTVRLVLDELAADAPSDATILGLCRDALVSCTDFVRAHELVTVYDDPVDVVTMPEIDRGVAVAYCRPSGPLEQAPLPTEFAVSPTPTGWTGEQVRSFYREYNEHMLHNLTGHEAMPGHALQLMHANRYRGRSAVRAVWWSGTFVEGWAVYSEQLMAAHGYRAQVSATAAAALRMQQLKMQLRSTINTILDIRFHCDDLDEAAAMDLMQRRGFQEQGEAAGKWRRVQLSSTQLCTYFVGYTEVRDLAVDLRAAQPHWSEHELHDAMLAHGSPPPRHLRAILGLAG